MNAPTLIHCSCIVSPRGGMAWDYKCPVIGHRTLAATPGANAFRGQRCRCCDKPVQPREDVVLALEEAGAELLAIVAAMPVDKPCSPLDRDLINQHATVVRCAAAQLCGFCSPNCELRH